ncbi:MAG: hypothetical protein IJC31_09805 [Spirochaetaceae bacterium]|nr:hypothetical protein [Spirochaetaceae bacterium]
MKKKLIFFIIALLCTIFVGGGTYAYFTTNVVTHNVISSGKVDIELVELSSEDGKAFEDVSGVMPGQSHSKIVMAENVGESDAWIRFRLKKTITAADGKTKLDESLVKPDVNSEGWTEKDGWYYYDKALKPGEKTAPFISAVGFDMSMSNEWKNAVISLDVYMQAVQVANNGSTVLEAQGWPLFGRGGV